MKKKFCPVRSDNGDFSSYPTTKDAIHAYLHKNLNPDECWDWLGHKDKNGYGRLTLRGKDKRAHRVYYELEHGEIPSSIMVCHKCDNPSCVNPRHLYAGSAKDNYNDMRSKERHKVSRGERNGTAKLKEENIPIIIFMRRSGIKLSDISKVFNVSESVISNICNRKSWRHIDS